VLKSAIAGQHFASTITMHPSSTDSPVPDGTANTAFLKGCQRPERGRGQVTATFLLETLRGSPRPPVATHADGAAEFQRLSWPHVTVGTLRK
jgi:hypothetical protein